MAGAASRHVVLVWRELGQFSDVSAYVGALATVLAEDRPVTVITEAGATPSVPLPASVDVLTIPAPGPGDALNYTGPDQVYSAAVFACIRERFADAPPAFIEFQDRGGEGLVTLQARQAGHPLLATTTCVVRLHGTTEMVAVLNAALPRTPEPRGIVAAERTCLQYADHLLCADEAAFEAYRSFYGAASLAPVAWVPHPAVHPASDQPWDDDATLRLVCVSPLERRAGVHALIAAMRMLPRDDVHLTLVGDDTCTGPLRTSVRDAIEVMTQGDPRIALVGPVTHAERAVELGRAHLGVLASRWDAAPDAALACLAANRPLIMTPVGGLPALVGDGPIAVIAERADSTRALAEAIARACDERERLRDAVAAGAPAARYRALTQPARITETYEHVAMPRRYRGRTTPSASRPKPLVTAIVPYYRAHRWVEQTLQSLSAQTYQPMEIVIVNDGSFLPEDRVIARLAVEHRARLISRPNGGISRARHLGIAAARGTYLAFLDADNVFHPEFIERGVALLEEDRELAYFTSWLQGMDHHARPLAQLGSAYPLGNHLEMLNDHNVAGDAAFLVRRSVLAQGIAYDELLPTFEDYDLYRQLRDAGMRGAVYPEPLIDYRFLPGSNSDVYGRRNLESIRDELRAARQVGALR